jgi:uncharacterized protein YcbK (DUF882 family)
LTRDRKLKTARSSNGYRRSLRFSGCASLAALLILLGSQSLQNATANGDTRSLTLRHTHTNEKVTITFKVNGRYDDEALKKVNHVLRDWREDQTISMDPHLLDLIWDVYREVEATEPIAIVCGYRSPGTNAMLRRRSSGAKRACARRAAAWASIRLRISSISTLAACGIGRGCRKSSSPR